MKITLIRHAKVDYQFKLWYRALEFDEAVKGYDESPIHMDLTKEFGDLEGSLYVSGLQRTHETAKLVFPQMQYTEDRLFDEIPARAFTKISVRLPGLVWLLMARIQWYLESEKQLETRKESKARAMCAVDVLEACEEQQVTLICHGLFMRVLVRELQRRGYQLKSKATYGNLDEICLGKD